MVYPPTPNTAQSDAEDQIRLVPEKDEALEIDEIR
jgi:hypothetical protein